MTQLGDLRIEGQRLAESTTDALSDDIIARLAELAGDSLVLLEQITRVRSIKPCLRLIIWWRTVILIDW